MDIPSRLRDEMLFKPPMVLICSSSGFDIRRSISSGVAPEYVVETVTTPNDMSGISSVFSFENDIIPNTMTINIIDRKKTGRFTDKEGMLIFYSLTDLFTYSFISIPFDSKTSLIDTWYFNIAIL